MSKLPRILPLVAIAAGGVLAVRAVSGLEGAPEFLQGARAWAEEAAPGGPSAKAAGKSGAAPAAARPAATAASRPPAAVCAPSAAELAREAGLSPAELRVLQSLGERRGQLDAREKAFETQVALLNAAETKVDARIKALNALKAELTGLVGKADEQREAEIARLVKVYESMKPKDAAQVMTQLDDRVLLPVAGKMKERSLAAILAQMPPMAAKALTEKLADRFASEGAAARVAAAVSGTAPTETAAPKPAAEPAAAAPAPPRKARPRPAAARTPPKPAPKPPAVAAAAPPPPAAQAVPETAQAARPTPRGDGPV